MTGALAGELVKMMLWNRGIMENTPVLYTVWVTQKILHLLWWAV